jgi:hypothetical protein
VEFNRFLYWVFEVFNIDGGERGLGKGQAKKLLQKRIIEFTCGKSTYKFTGNFHHTCELSEIFRHFLLIK